MRARASSPAFGPAILLTLLALSACLFGGCNRGAKTPEEALERLRTAVLARDGVKLYEALDLPTRWSWMTVRRAHREAYDIILSNFPEGPARDEQSHRFETGALSTSEAELFAQHMKTDRWDQLTQAIEGAKGPPVKNGDEATVAVEKPAGAETAPPPIKLRKGDDGRWGFSGFADEGEDLKKRASADLELMRTSAADMERAATRAGQTEKL